MCSDQRVIFHKLKNHLKVDKNSDLLHKFQNFREIDANPGTKPGFCLLLIKINLILDKSMPAPKQRAVTHYQLIDHKFYQKCARSRPQASIFILCKNLSKLFFLKKSNLTPVGLAALKIDSHSPSQLPLTTLLKDSRNPCNATPIAPLTHFTVKHSCWHFTLLSC